MKGLHWFRQDLRVQDNPALFKLNQEVTEMLCVYIIDSALLEPDRFNVSSTKPVSLSTHRQQFLAESLLDLQSNLNKLGQKLLIKCGNPNQILNELIEEHEVDVISASWHCGQNEQHQWQSVTERYPNKSFIYENAATLYRLQELPFALENMPDTFLPFRKKIEKYVELDLKVLHIDDFVSCPEIDYEYSLKALSQGHSNEEYTGGASAALARIQEYFWQSDGIADYKETRNGLDGWDFSSRLSAWLANGSISARQIMLELKAYEQQRTKNDSTYWLFFELLWREFFHWQHAKHGKLFFDKNGVQGKHLSSSIQTQKFEQWKSGTTGYAIVDACMRQLKQTGFMSNRGRQLVASCFVHELDLDWRYGAAYFEQQLIDFDVASNYGNWQYLAGVGADPRGHRQFNLEKQTDTYDPQRHFINKWC